jgi:AcrR family transcriptional regulator
MPDTKRRILDIATDLFARQGYAGTTIADIARELGTTTAALYYHFTSKADILGALLEEPLLGYMRLSAALRSDQVAPEDVLSALIDLVADTRELSLMIDRDPAVHALIDERLPRPSDEIIGEMVTALAGGPGADRAAQIRAHEALAVVKSGTMAALTLAGSLDSGQLAPQDRAQVLGSAMNVLNYQARS